MVSMLPHIEAPPKHVCEGCILGKMQRASFPKDGFVRVECKLQLVHIDACGPMQTPSFGNYLYFATFIDDYSRHAWVYPLKAKSEVFLCFKHFVVMAENVSKCKVGTFHSDQGGSMCLRNLMHFWLNVASNINAQCHIPLRKMVLLRGRIGHLWRWRVVWLKAKLCHIHFGLRLSCVPHMY